MEGWIVDETGKPVECGHPSTFALYRRGPRANGSPFVPFGFACEDCGFISRN